MANNQFYNPSPSWSCSGSPQCHMKPNELGAANTHHSMQLSSSLATAPPGRSAQPASARGHASNQQHDGAGLSTSAATNVSSKPSSSSAPSPFRSYETGIMVKSTAKILQNIGFESAHSMCVNILASMQVNYFEMMCRTAMGYANNAGRIRPGLQDVAGAFKEMGVDLTEMHDYIREVEPFDLGISVPNLPVADVRTKNKDELKEKTADKAGDLTAVPVERPHILSHPAQASQRIFPNFAGCKSIDLGFTPKPLPAALRSQQLERRPHLRAPTLAAKQEPFSWHSSATATEEFNANFPSTSAEQHQQRAIYAGFSQENSKNFCQNDLNAMNKSPHKLKKKKKDKVEKEKKRERREKKREHNRHINNNNNNNNTIKNETNEYRVDDGGGQKRGITMPHKTAKAENTLVSIDQRHSSVDDYDDEDAGIDDYSASEFSQQLRHNHAAGIIAEPVVQRTARTTTSALYNSVEGGGYSMTSSDEGFASQSQSQAGALRQQQSQSSRLNAAAEFGYSKTSRHIYNAMDQRHEPDELRQENECTRFSAATLDSTLITAASSSSSSSSSGAPAAAIAEADSPLDLGAPPQLTSALVDDDGEEDDGEMPALTAVERVPKLFLHHHQQQQQDQQQFSDDKTLSALPRSFDAKRIDKSPSRKEKKKKKKDKRDKEQRRLEKLERRQQRNSSAADSLGQFHSASAMTDEATLIRNESFVEEPSTSMTASRVVDEAKEPKVLKLKIKFGGFSAGSIKSESVDTSTPPPPPTLTSMVARNCAPAQSDDNTSASINIDANVSDAPVAPPLISPSSCAVFDNANAAVASGVKPLKISVAAGGGTQRSEASKTKSEKTKGSKRRKSKPVKSAELILEDALNEDEEEHGKRGGTGRISPSAPQLTAMAPPNHRDVPKLEIDREVEKKLKEIKSSVKEAQKRKEENKTLVMAIAKMAAANQPETTTPLDRAKKEQQVERPQSRDDAQQRVKKSPQYADEPIEVPRFSPGKSASAVVVKKSETTKPTAFSKSKKTKMKSTSKAAEPSAAASLKPIPRQSIAESLFDNCFAAENCVEEKLATATAKPTSEIKEKSMNFSASQKSDKDTKKATSKRSQALDERPVSVASTAVNDKKLLTPKKEKTKVKMFFTPSSFRTSSETKKAASTSASTASITSSSGKTKAAGGGEKRRASSTLPADPHPPAVKRKKIAATSAPTAGALDIGEKKSDTDAAKKLKSAEQQRSASAMSHTEGSVPLTHNNNNDGRESGALRSSADSPALDADDENIWICPECSVAYVDGAADMVGCDNCDRWFHWHCVGLLIAPPENKKWFCRDCAKKRKKESTTGQTTAAALPPSAKIGVNRPNKKK